VIKFVEEDEFELVDYKGTQFKLRLPTFADSNNYQKKIQSADEHEQANMLPEYLIDLGAPRELVEKMPVKHVLALVEAVNDIKK